MRIEDASRTGGPHLYQRSPEATGLPKLVRLRARKPPESIAPAGADVYEFEVVAASAAYGEGERFYLSPAQAKRVYF